MPIDFSFLENVAPKQEPEQKSSSLVNVTIRVDGDCFLICDGDFIDAEFKANKITKLELATGQHILEFKSVADASNVVEKVVDYSEKGKSYLLIVQGLGEKSKEEKQRDNIAEFEKQVQLRLDDDRRIDSQEAAELENIRKNLGLDVKTAQIIINEARRQIRQDSRGTIVREGSTFSIDILKDAILKNDLDKVRTILPDVAAAIDSSDQASTESKTIQCLYYMCMVALDSKELIQMHESSYVDNYWRTYWVFVAYSRNKLRAKAADILSDLQNIYLDYPDDNVDLLRAIDVYNNIGKEEAMQCVNWVDGNFSPELMPLAEAVRYELGVEKPATRQKEAQVAFIQNLVVSFEDLSIRMKRKEQEEAELRRKVTYTLAITEVRDQMMGMMVVRAALGWGASDSRKKFVDLPVVALVTESKTDAISVYNKLSEGKMTVEVKSENALGEIVDSTNEFECRYKATIEEEQSRISVRKKAEEEEKRRAAEAAARKKAEEERHRAAEAAARKRAAEEARRNVFEVSANTLHFGVEGGTKVLTVDCDRSWEISTDLESWGTATPGSGKLTIKIKANTEAEARTDYMKIKCGNAELRIDIKQDGAGYKCSGTTRSYTDNAKALSHLIQGLKERWDKECRRGCITEGGMGVLFKDLNTNNYQGLTYSDLRERIDKYEEDTSYSIYDIALTDSGYYCLIYDEGLFEDHKWYGNVPSAMKSVLDDCVDKSQSFYSVSIAENGDYAIITDKLMSSRSTNSRVQNVLNKAQKMYGEVLYADITNLGVVACCKRGVYYENIPTNVAEKIQDMVNAKKVINFISFTDSGTCIMSDDDDDAVWYM